VFVASLNDQVVPLYSGISHAFHHPGILRSLFIDGTAFTQSDFMARIVVFATRLLNANISDHGLINYLSDPLAGMLAGTGHSVLYKEREVYNLALSYYFETTSTLSAPTSTAPRSQTSYMVDESLSPKEKNAYFIPWALRGILEDQRVIALYSDELAELREAFEVNLLFFGRSPVAQHLSDTLNVLGLGTDFESFA
jgi:hypothetical protein